MYSNQMLCKTRVSGRAVSAACKRIGIWSGAAGAEGTAESVARGGEGTWRKPGSSHGSSQGITALSASVSPGQSPSRILCVSI